MVPSQMAGGPPWPGKEAAAFQTSPGALSSVGSPTGKRKVCPVSQAFYSSARTIPSDRLHNTA